MENSVIIKNHIFKECVLAVTILLSHSPQTLVFQSFRESPPLILLQPLWILLGHHFPFPDRSQCLFSVPNILAVHSFYCFLTYMCVCMLIHFNRVQLCATLWTAAHQAPLSMGFPPARILEWVAISFRLPINPHHPELCTVNILSYFPSIFTYLQKSQAAHSFMPSFYLFVTWIKMAGAS